MFKIVKKHPLHTLMTKTIIESSEYLLFYSSRGQSRGMYKCNENLLCFHQPHDG